MRIVLLTLAYCDDPTYLSVFGGLGRAYARLGHRVTAAGQNNPALGLPRREELPWGAVERLGGATSFWTWRYAVTCFQLLGALREKDLVHLHWSGQPNPLLPWIWLACRWRGAPLAVTLQNFGNPALAPLAGVRLALVRLLLGRVEWLTALSRATAAAAGRALPALTGRLRVVPNGCEPEPSDVDAPLQAARPFVLCAARLAPHKGTDVLLMAWSEVCAAEPDVELVLCGPEPTPGAYQEFAARLGLAGRARFLGTVDGARARELMRQSVFVVLPSRHESFGMAALEAMACGKAVLATRAGGPEDFIADGESGLLAPPADAAALRDGMLRLLRDPALRERLGARARESARAYSWDAVAARYLALLDEAPARRTAPGATPARPAPPTPASGGAETSGR